jgi:hypothetical protein
MHNNHIHSLTQHMPILVNTLAWANNDLQWKGNK